MSARNLKGPVARYVVGFLFYQDSVLLIRKAKPAWQQGRLNGIGGKVEGAESFEDAMRREFQEETGLSVQDWEHVGMLVGDDRDDERIGKDGGEFVVAFYRAEIQEIPQLTPATEPVEWFNTKRLPEDVLPNLRWLVPMAYYAHRADWPFLWVERKGTGETVTVGAKQFLP